MAYLQLAAKFGSYLNLALDTIPNTYFFAVPTLVSIGRFTSISWPFLSFISLTSKLVAAMVQTPHILCIQSQVINKPLSWYRPRCDCFRKFRLQSIHL